jgi:mannose-6-phosphate isomerase-like protein (cupin superfamily)
MKKICLPLLLLVVCQVGFAQSKPEEKVPEKRVSNAFDIIKENEKTNSSYGVFMRNPSISSGVYTLKKGATDEQHPHSRDEIYYIIKGKAKIKVGTENYDVTEGSLVFVEAFKEHRFFDITEDLAVVVFFSAEQGAPKTK